MPKNRSDYGISRIDQPEKKNHGFYVRITHDGVTHQKYFPDKANKGKAKALRAARAYRDEVLASLPKEKQEFASRKPRKIQKSGVTGVTHVVSRTAGSNATYEYWQASWLDDAGRRITRKFSIKRYGNDKALRLAKKARRDALKGS